GAGRTGKDWNERILNNPHFQVLEWEPNAKNIFPDPNLKGGGMYLSLG
ncbi:MAG: Eco57I restriction-modification methylase domain-containing protein, partial [Aeriscardovia sp.]|nr:Eco57I restriction-modification methylase domain-containing protein [Aeriscardovia sp.]